MDPALLSTAMYAAQGLSALPKYIGAMQNASANKKYDEYVKNRTFELQNLFNNQYNQNFLDTEEAKGVIRNMLNQIKEASDNVKSSSKITGASAEKEVAQKDKMNENFSNVLTQLASMGTQRKDRIMGNYLNAKSGLDGLNLQKYAREAASGNQAQQNASGLTDSMLMLTTLAGGTPVNPIATGNFFDQNNFNQNITPQSVPGVTPYSNQTQFGNRDYQNLMKYLPTTLRIP